MSDSRLADKSVIITGGCDGIGRAAVDLFARHGAQIVVLDVQREKGAALEEEYGGAVRFSHGDINQEQDWNAAVSLAVEAHGGLDVMYHNAAIPATQSKIEDITVEQWDKDVSQLLTASMLAVKTSVPAMRRRGGGSIILTSATGAYSLVRDAKYIYAIMKGGVSNLGRAAALEYAADRIRVNTVVPGAIASPLHLKTAGYDQDQADKMWPYFKDLLFEKFQPLPVIGEARDIAHAALFLASDDARWITGVNLPIDGGLLLDRPLQPGQYEGAMQEAERLATANN